MNLQRRLRLIADIIDNVNVGTAELKYLKASMTKTGDIKPYQVESLVFLGKEFGFLELHEDGSLSTTKQGRSFGHYVADLDETLDEAPEFDRGLALTLCVTLPPDVAGDIKSALSDLIMDTMDAQRAVIEDAKKELMIICPFIDVAVFQLALKDILKKDVALTLITSEKALARKFPGGRNFELEKLESLVRTRFKSGRVYYLASESTIAHAKVWFSDCSVFVTSANIRSDSATENLEMGIYTDDTQLLERVRDLAARLLKLADLQCILSVG
jgi:hypothetical protein